MFDKEQFKKEIEQQLKNVPRDKRVAFSVRSAMRLLPLLAEQEKPSVLTKLFNAKKNRTVFWFWKEYNKKEYLLNILIAYSINIECILIKKHAVNSIFSVESSRTSTAISVISKIGLISDFCIHIVDIFIFINSSVGVIQEIKNDLKLINKLTAKELLERPLWSKIIPNDWQQLLADFKSDVLSLNAGFEVWLDWYDDRLQGKTIDIELLKKLNAIPQEIEEQGVIEVNTYLKNLVQKTAIKPLNRVRAIFIGYGEAGKTSLIRVLNNETVIEGKEDMTAGIAIRYWQIPNTDIEAHFWDFGGQVMAHATHQFFLRASCLYVLVLKLIAPSKPSIGLNILKVLRVTRLY